MASQVAATTPDAGAVYEQAVRAVMARWTPLRLAVDQGCPSARKAPHVEDVEDLLFDGIESKFNSQAEDGSVEEIAKLVISLRNECAAGELGNALAAIARATQAPALAQCVSQGEPEENVDSDDDMDDAPPPALAAVPAFGAVPAFAPAGETPAEAHRRRPSASPPRRVAAAMDTLAFEDIAPAVDTFCPPAPPDDANLEAASEQLGDLGLDDEPAPAWACKYCGIRDPSAVVRCVESDKWFCNSTGGTSGSHIVQHLVRAKHNQVCLHKDSPLGETVLECYNCGCRNVFLIGFVPAKTESVVVLLCRVCVETVHALKSMDWDLDEWLPLIADRRFLPWLDGYHYQNVLAPLVKLEADHDRRVREAQARACPCAGTGPLGATSPSFVGAGNSYASYESNELRLAVGDELKIRLNSGGARQRQALGGVGPSCASRPANRAGAADVQCPTEVTECGFVDFVWKGTSYDRMQNALKNLAVDDRRCERTSTTGSWATAPSPRC
ncbi:hypothetical protein JL722_12674 [Aureococcus anophagefferens]|nr:hypothetical protein JL722_12674 [Aureococcus anophagefferens]